MAWCSGLVFPDYKNEYDFMAVVLERIIESFDEKPDASIQKAWAETAERRLRAYKRGEADTLTEEEVFERIEKGYET